jgi:hypothetical protein
VGRGEVGDINILVPPVTLLLGWELGFGDMAVGVVVGTMRCAGGTKTLGFFHGDHQPSSSHCRLPVGDVARL